MRDRDGAMFHQDIYTVSALPLCHTLDILPMERAFFQLLNAVWLSHGFQLSARGELIVSIGPVRGFASFWGQFILSLPFEANELLCLHTVRFVWLEGGLTVLILGLRSSNRTASGIIMLSFESITLHRKCLVFRRPNIGQFFFILPIVWKSDCYQLTEFNAILFQHSLHPQ